MHAAANVAIAATADLSFTAPECNSVGAALIGGKPLSSAIEAARQGFVDTVLVLENELYRRAPAADVDALFQSVKNVIVLDHLPTSTTEKAQLVLPAGTFAESDGTFISSEGRAQRFFQVFVPRSDVVASWRWLKADDWTNLDDAIDAICASYPELAVIREAAPAATFRISGAKVARSPHRNSGRTAVLANIDVSEPKPPQDPDSPLSFSMEGTAAKPPGALIPFVWSPGWNSIQATNTYQKEVGGPLRGGDPGVRVIEPGSSTTPSYFTRIPAEFPARIGEWLIVPMHHFFGSEELSLRAPAVAELATKPYVGVGVGDFHEDAEVEVRFGDVTLRLPVRVQPELPPGVATISAGMQPTAGIKLPAWGKIARLP